MRIGQKLFLILLTILFLNTLYTYLLNESFIAENKKGIYNEKKIEKLKTRKTLEDYIANYNEGNMYFQKGEYEKARKSYEEALQKNPPKRRVCDIEINLSLTYVKQATNNEEEILKKARETLYLNHCADEKDKSGISMDAENLEEEIKKLEAKETNGEKQEQTSSHNNSSNQENKAQELKERNKEAKKSRQSSMASDENLDNFDFYYGKNW